MILSVNDLRVLNVAIGFISDYVGEHDPCQPVSVEHALRKWAPVMTNMKNIIREAERANGPLLPVLLGNSPPPSDADFDRITEAIRRIVAAALDGSRKPAP